MSNHGSHRDPPGLDQDERNTPRPTFPARQEPDTLRVLEHPHSEKTLEFHLLPAPKAGI